MDKYIKIKSSEGKPAKKKTTSPKLKSSPTKKSNKKTNSSTDTNIALLFSPKKPSILPNKKIMTIKPPNKPKIDSFLNDVWSSPSLIPFVKNEAFEKTEEWITNFSHSQPCCILFGETGSGKSRIINQISIKFSLHIMYIDCASIKDAKTIVNDAAEATKSHSMGGVFSSGLGNTNNSMVVFEHFDALISQNNRIPTTIQQILVDSRVPVILTAYKNVFRKESWILPVFCKKLENAEDIIAGSVWFSRGWDSDKTECIDSVKKLLYMTDNDIRKTSMQMMCMRNHHMVIPRDEMIYNSIPSLCNNGEETDMYMYADLMDSLCILDPNDLFFDDCISSEEIISKPFGHEERVMRDKAKQMHKLIPSSRTTFMPDVEIMEIASNAAQNAIMKTRTLKMVGIPNVRLTNEEIDEIAYFYMYE